MKESPQILRSEPVPAPALSPLLWLNLLSLDAPAVAALWQLLFARCFRVDLSTRITVLLALVVWLIYVTDRLLDSLSIPVEGREAVRHRFYRRHRWAFLLPSGVAFALAGWMSLKYLDARTFRYGLGLSLAVGAYFGLIHLRRPRMQPWLPKEMLVGVLFGLGTCFPVWERLPGRSFPMLAPYLVFTALCWMNCSAIEFSEWTRLRGSRCNMPHRWTVGVGRWMTFFSLVIAIVSLSLMLTGLGRSIRPLLWAEALSAMIFAVLNIRSERLSNDQFRVLMDLALFTPVLILPLLHL